MRGSWPCGKLTSPARGTRRQPTREKLPHLSEIGDEHLFGANALVTGSAQDGRWMNGREDRPRPLGLEGDAARLHDAEGSSQEGFCGDRAEADDDVGLDERDLALKPREACANFAGVRRLVDASLCASVARPLEMLHGVRDVDVVAIDARRIECLVE